MTSSAPGGPRARERESSWGGGHDDLRRVEFFDSRVRALAFARAGGAVDVLASHQAVLGRGLHGLCRQAGADLETRFACGHLTRVLRDRRPLRVRLTFSGLAGDAGVHCPHGLLFARGQLRNRFGREPALLETALASREIVRVADRVIVTHDSACMTYCAGLANDELLSPFMPKGRNEDGVFGALLSYADATALSAHLPHGVIHDSIRPSAYDTREIASAWSRSSGRAAGSAGGRLPRATSNVRVTPSNAQL